MTAKRVVTQLFQVDVLALARRRNVPGPPAVLVIPLGGRLRSPRLMLVGERPAGTDARLGALDFSDAHVVARCDDPGDPAGQLADVLIGRLAGPSSLGRLLDRHPGCGVAAGPGLAALRDPGGPRGTGVPQMIESSGGGRVWPVIGGSFLYGWSAAGLTMTELYRSVLIVGEFGDGRLGVTGRVHLRRPAA